MSGVRGDYVLFDTAFGVCGLGWSEAGIAAFQLPSADRDRDEARLRSRMKAEGPGKRPPNVAAAIDDLRAYFMGEMVNFSELGVDLAEVEPFHRAVLTEARRIGCGDISSYGVLARTVSGDVSTSRAVGQAMACSPIPVVIACHRVLAADGTIGGFSAPGGGVRKTKLLELEGSLNKTPSLAQTSFGF